jgi:hypothetical protein
MQGVEVYDSGTAPESALMQSCLLSPVRSMLAAAAVSPAGQPCAVVQLCNRHGVPGLFLPQDEAALEALLPTAAAVAALIAAFHSVEAAVRLANLRADAATVPRAPPAPLRSSLLVQAVASAARVLGASRGRLLLLHPPSQQLQPWLDVAAAGTVAPGDVDDEQPELDTIQYTVTTAALAVAAGAVQSSVSIDWDDPHSLCLPLMTPLGGAPFGVLQFGGRSRSPSQGASLVQQQQSFDGSSSAVAAGYDRFLSGSTTAGGRLQYTQQQQQQQPYFSAEDAELARVFAPHVASLLLGTRGSGSKANSASFAQYAVHDARSAGPATAGESLTALAARERCADSVAAVWPALAAALASADTLQQACAALCTAVRSTVPCSRARAYLPWTDSSSSSSSSSNSNGANAMLVAEVPSGARYSVQCATSSAAAAAGDHGDPYSDGDSTDSTDSGSGGLLLAAVHTGLPQYATGGAATHNDCEDGFGEAGMWEIAVLPLLYTATTTASSTTAATAAAAAAALERQKHSSRRGRPQQAGHRSAVAAGVAQALQTQTESRSCNSSISAVAGLLHVGRAEGAAPFSATEVRYVV